MTNGTLMGLNELENEFIYMPINDWLVPIVVWMKKVYKKSLAALLSYRARREQMGENVNGVTLCYLALDKALERTSKPNGSTA